MDIKSINYDSLVIDIDINATLSDDIVSKLSVTLRDDYPNRRDMRDNYLAVNAKAKKAFLVKNELVTIRFDEIEDIYEIISNASNVMKHLMDVFESDEIKFSVNLTADAILEENVFDISLKQLAPVGINSSSIPGEITAFATRIFFTVDGYEYDLSINPDFDNNENIYIDIDVEPVENGVYIINHNDNYLKEISGFKVLLEDTLRKIVGKW